MDDINAALSSMTYTPNTDFTGEATLTLTTNDLGNEDDFGSEALTVTDTLTITVNEVNDAPILDYPEAVLTSSEDSLLLFPKLKALQSQSPILISMVLPVRSSLPWAWIVAHLIYPTQRVSPLSLVATTALQWSCSELPRT